MNNKTSRSSLVNNILWTMVVVIVLAVASLLYLSSIVAQHGGPGVDIFSSSRGIVRKDPVFVDFGSNLKLAIPSNYFLSPELVDEAHAPRPKVLLWTLFPSFEGYSREKEAELLGWRGRIVLDIRPILRPEAELKDIVGEGYLEKIQRKDVYLQRVAKAPPDPAFPGLEVYKSVYAGTSSETFYVLNRKDRFLIAQCADFPDPVCTVSKRWKLNIFVDYQCKKSLLIARFLEIDDGVNALLESFVVKQ